MNNPIRRAVIVGSARVPFARSNTAYATLGNQDMLTAAMKAVVDRFDLRGAVLGEVAAGAVIKHARDWNLAREAALGSGLDPHTPAYDVQRACGHAISNPRCRESPRRARGSPWASTASSWRRNGGSDARSRTSSPTRAT